jgi:HD-GYP domain-containing protein (c-di-GMP phosphodiesterase class II)
VFVPMLFVLPLGWVPAAVGAGYVLSIVGDRTREGHQVGRIFVLLSSSWYAFGPIAVLATLHVPTIYWHAWQVLLLAFAAQCLLDAAIATGREWLAHGVSPLVLAPFLVRAYLVDAMLAPAGLVAAFAAARDPVAFVFVLPSAGLLWMFARERRQHLDETLGLSAAYRGMVILLGDLIENDDAYTASHSHDVVGLVLALCEEMGLSAADRRDAEFTALLHDVGKIKIPDEIISKPDRLTDAERAIIDTHTIEGEKILATVGGDLTRVGKLVRSCHERWDGDGYPDRLRGEQIPLIARIICCCDAYSAITTDRPYRAARTTIEALAEIHRCAGTQFDPTVTEALARVLQRMPVTNQLARSPLAEAA